MINVGMTPLNLMKMKMKICWAWLIYLMIMMMRPPTPEFEDGTRVDAMVCNDLAFTYRNYNGNADLANKQTFNINNDLINTVMHYHIVHSL
jgi:hypothetical protein